MTEEPPLSSSSCFQKVSIFYLPLVKTHNRLTLTVEKGQVNPVCKLLAPLRFEATNG